MRLYVAGPMTGIKDFNYPAFLEAEKRLVAHGYNVLNPVRIEQHNPTPGIPQAWEWYMRRALRMVLDADGVALLPGWVKSRGARLETQVAETLGTRVAALDTWLEEEAP